MAIYAIGNSFARIKFPRYAPHVRYVCRNRVRFSKFDRMAIKVNEKKSEPIDFIDGCKFKLQ